MYSTVFSVFPCKCYKCTQILLLVHNVFRTRLLLNTTSNITSTVAAFVTQCECTVLCYFRAAASIPNEVRHVRRVELLEQVAELFHCVSHLRSCLSLSVVLRVPMMRLLVMAMAIVLLLRALPLRRRRRRRRAALEALRLFRWLLSVRVGGRLPLGHRKHALEEQPGGALQRTPHAQRIHQQPLAV